MDFQLIKVYQSDASPPLLLWLLTMWRSCLSISRGTWNSPELLPVKRGETEKLELMVEK